MADISDKLGGCLIEEIISASNRHYNKGLFLAEKKDLSGAQSELKKSLKFYKYNTDARNLLGLIFYRQGETAMAMLEWAVSAGLKKRENLAGKYIEAMQAYPDGMKKLNSPLRQYNTALINLRNKHFDIAVLELKKAVEESPCFIRAKQLLALIYMRQGKLKEAYKLLQSTLEIDKYNACSLEFLKEIEDYGRTGVKKRNGKLKKPVLTLQKNEICYKKEESNRNRSYVYIAGGFLIGAAVIGLLAVPAVTGRLRAEFNAQVIDYSEMLSRKNEEVYTLQKKLEANEAKADDAAAAVNTRNNDSDTALFFKAIKAYMMNERENAGQLIASVNPEKLEDGAMTDVYSLICSETKELVLEDIYKTADEAFSSENYKAALSEYERADRLDKKPQNKLMMAKCYEKLADIVKAKACYRDIAEDYPGTNEADTAKQAIEKIESEITQR